MDGLDDHDGRAYSDGVALRVVIDPPDPSWIGGYWDDDDFGSGVDSILHTCAVEPTSPDDVGPPRAARCPPDRSLNAAPERQCAVARAVTRARRRLRSPPTRPVPHEGGLRCGE